MLLLMWRYLLFLMHFLPLAPRSVTSLPFRHHRVDEEWERNEILKIKLSVENKTKPGAVEVAATWASQPCSFAGGAPRSHRTTLSLQQAFSQRHCHTGESHFRIPPLQDGSHGNRLPMPDFRCGKKKKETPLFVRLLSIRQLENDQDPPNTICHLVFI